MKPANLPYFLTDPDWFEFDEENCAYVLTNKATPEARKSYEEYYKFFDEAPEIDE